LAVVAPFIGWVAALSLKKVDVGPFEVAQSLLARHARDFLEEAGCNLLFERG